MNSSSSGHTEAYGRAEVAWLLAIVIVAAVAWYARTIASFPTLPTP